MTTTRPKISLIVATYNGAARIMPTLQSIAAQTLAPEKWEAVIVNNNSSDATARVVGDFIAAHEGLNIRLVDEPAQGLSNARNCGIANSLGDYIAIIDDDERASLDLLRLYVEFFDAHPEVAAAGGSIVAHYPSGRPAWMSGLTERPIAGTLSLGSEVKPFPKGRYFGGGNMAIRRSVIERYGAFDPSLGRNGNTLLGGEEKELYGRLKAGGEQVFYLPEAYIEHIIPATKLTRDYFRAVCLRIGQSERIRTLSLGWVAYAKRLVSEAVKWCATLLLCFAYLAMFDGAKADYLWLMRVQISRGLLGRLKV